ncbi:hypothetical protein Tco_1510634, partial [Tanacetum coccineum]
MVAPTRSESELEASVDKLVDEGGSTDQEDFAAGGGHDVVIELVTGVENVAAENVIAKRPRRQRKKRPAVTDASGSPHPPKKLKGDHETSSGAATGGKSPYVLKELLASSILNVEVGVEVVATLPLVTSSVSTMPGRKGGNPTDSIIGFNLRTIGPSKRFIIFLDSSHHSSTHASRAEVDSIIRSVVLPPVMTEAVVTSHAVSDPLILVPEMGTKITSPVHASMFHDSNSTETVRADAAGPSAKQDLSMGYRELNTETLHQVFVPQWNIREIDYHHLFTEFNVGTARQACVNAKAKDDEVENLKAQLLLKIAEAAEATDDEVENLKAQLLLKEAEAAEAARLRAQNEKDSLARKVIELQSSVFAKDLELKDLNVHVLETTCSSLRDQVSGYEPLKEQVEEFQDAQMNIVNDKVAKLDADLLEMA